MFDKPMEHRKVEGGGHWLAFAEGEARRLRATGLSYVSKRLPMPDGATVEVRIEPNHTYIHISGGQVDIGMDSGVVDVYNVGLTHPDRYRTGTLYETDYVQGYHAPFQLQDGDPPRMKLPRTGNDGQFAGILRNSGKKFTGKVPVDLQDAKSFRPDRNSEGAENPADEELARKKRCAVLCPPSMFTGKLRLYVQALYGAHLSEKAGKDHVAPFELVEGQSRPALRLNNRFFNPDAPGPDHRVLLSTGNGLHLDKTTGKHWLFTFTSGMRAFKMRAPAAVEKLRPWLIDPPIAGHPDPSHPLSDEDREHLEAYILSQCLPYGDTTVMPNPWCTPDSGAVADPWCMGYSWHWNWSGTAAIARVNEVFEQDLTNSAMRTRTYQVEVTKVAEDLFDVRQLISEAPIEWSVYRTLWTITEPDWGTGTQLKMTPKHSSVFASEATFYSFYRRDDIVNCSVRVYSHEGDPASVTFTNGATGGPDGTNCFTVGTKEGARINSLGSPSYTAARFNCGDASTPALPLSNNITTHNDLEVKNKVFADWVDYDNLPLPAIGPQDLTVSNDDGTNQHLQPVYGRVYKTAGRGQTFDSSVSSKRIENYGQATVVVPLYDAEAVYLQASVARHTYVTANTTYHLYNNPGAISSLGYFLVRIGHSPDDVVINYYSYAQNIGGTVSDNHGLLSTESIIPAPIFENTYDSEQLICSAGLIDATFQNLGAFHDNAEESVSSGFNTLTGTKVDPDGVAIAPTYITTDGTPDTNVPVLVGWV